MIDRSTSEHLLVVMTTESTDDVTETTAAGVLTPPSSFGIEYYFQCAVLVVGIVGTAANALILYALIVSKQHKKQKLIFNQNVVDFFACLFLIVIRAFNLSKFSPSGKAGYWFCVLISSETMFWCFTLTSKANIMLITAERYLKIVYATWSKTHLRNWMVFSAIGFAWFSGFLFTFATAFLASDFIDGVCYSNALWASAAAYMVQVLWYILFYYVLMLIVFIFGYWRILLVLRRQARTLAGSNSSQAQSNQMRSNVIKTMILVSALYAICEFLMHLFHFVLLVDASVVIPLSIYYASIFFSVFYFCANPFIYAVKFDPVKRVLRGLIFWRNPASTVHPVETTGTHTRTGTAQQAHT